MEEFLYNKIRYTIVENYAVVIGYDKRYKNLSRVSLPEKVEYNGKSYIVGAIKAESFIGIEMTTIDIPKTLEYIELSALMCVVDDEMFDRLPLGPDRLSAINVAAGNPVYSSVDGVLYTKDKTELLLCPIGKRGKLKMPKETIKATNSEAIPGWNSRITSAEMPNTFTYIGSNKHFIKDKAGQTITIDGVPVKVFNAEKQSFIDKLFGIFGL